MFALFLLITFVVVVVSGVAIVTAVMESNRSEDFDAAMERVPNLTNYQS